ncbi:MAG TPA: hypothetical protein VL156_19510 [Terriglobales bacterium]|jgi:hypothetical protein|nr:hypothetical protein [Terriglobales bacterium]
MENLVNVLQQLRDERGRAKQQLEQLDSAITVLEGLGRDNSARTSSRAGRVVSPLARRRMAAAQRARWARARKASGKSASKPSVVRVLSPEARRRIAAAQKARWAKFRAEKKAA